MKKKKKKNETKTTEQEATPEVIIRQHRRQAYLLEGREVIGVGSLILTNRRLLFLNRIERSPEVEADIKKLADAPMKDVLDHAVTLHKDNFQIPLSSIIRPGIGTFIGFPLPRFCLSVFYLKGKKLQPHTVTFQFKNTRTGIFTQPQVITARNWGKTIRNAIEETTLE